MRYIWLIVPIMVLLNGCGEAPKKVVTPKNKIVKKSTKKIDIYVIKESSTNPNVQEMMRFVNIKKIGNLVKKTKGNQEFEVTSFDVNEAKNEYYIAGKYRNEHKDFGYDNIQFVAIYDKKSLAYKGMYYAKKYFGEFRVEDGRYVLLDYVGSGAIVYDMEKKHSVKLALKKDQRIRSFDRQKVSKDGKYIAIVTYDKNRKEQTVLGKTFLPGYVTVFSLKDGSITSRHSTNIAGLNIGYDFSKDGKLLAIGDRGSKISIQNMSEKYITSFGKPYESKYARSFIENFGNYFIAKKNVEAKTEARFKFETYVYDIKNNKLICTIDEARNDYMFLDTKNNLLYLNYSYNQSVYKVGTNSCIKIDERKIDLSRIPSSNRMMSKIRNRFYGFENGKVIYADAGEQSYSSEYLEALENLQKVKKYFKVGFEDKGYALLKELILDPKFDFFKEKRKQLLSSLTPLQKSFVYVTAYQRYKKAGITTDESAAYRVAMLDYIILASEANFYQLSYAMMQAQNKEYIKAGLSKKKKDAIKLFDANYLLDIGKDKEAYAILFELQPTSKVVKNYLAVIADRDIGLMKNKEKLAVALDIDKNLLKAKTRKIKKYNKFFNLEGKLVGKGFVPKKTEEKKLSSPKSDAIKLLD